MVTFAKWLAIFAMAATGSLIPKLAAADITELSSHNRNVLIGVWRGKVVSRGTDGEIHFSSPVVLRIKRHNKGLEGRFIYVLCGFARGQSTHVEIRNGKADVTLNSKVISLNLSHEKMTAQLSVSYDSQFGSWPRRNTLILRKK